MRWRRLKHLHRSIMEDAVLISVRNNFQPRLLGAGLLTTALLAGSFAPASAYDFAKQQALAEKAVRYLESTAPSRGDKDTMGREMLVARAIFKHRRNIRHPKVASAVALARQKMADPAYGKNEIYELGVSLTLLTELTPSSSLQSGDEHERELNRLSKQIYDRILARQSPNGSWGHDSGRGDTLLTQAALLGIWWRQEARLDNDSPAERACNWLLRTQSPDGAWAHRGTDPGTYARVMQDQPSLTTVLAGASGLYIAADLLNFQQKRKNASPFISVKPNKRGKPTTTVVDHARLWESLDLADRYWAANASVNAGELQLDYLHTLERYCAFRDHVRNHSVPRGGPRWYNDGVELLARTQAPDGHWISRENSAGPVADTALALLFLYHVRRVCHYSP